jgi:WD40 repeat protein
VLAVRFGPEAAPTLLVSGSVDATARVWDVTTQQCLAVCSPGSTSAWVRTARLFVDALGALRVAVGTGEGCLAVFDLGGVGVAPGALGGAGKPPDPAALAPVAVEQAGTCVHVLDVSPDGCRVALGVDSSDLLVCRLPGATGEGLDPRVRLTGHSSLVRFVAWYSKGRRLVSACKKW